MMCNMIGSGRRMFDSVAKHYDRINKYMSLGLDKQWREFLVENLQVWRRSDFCLFLWVQARYLNGRGRSLKEVAHSCCAHGHS